jgi:acetyl/propionyl-CoA carboxylase alpha subunit
MISKVVAWAADRTAAIARLKRALREYEIGGITTAIPALLWILGQDAFADGGFDTAYLDGVLSERRGRSFSELPDADVDLAVMAAALLTCLSGGDRPAGGESAGATPWRRAARLDGLRR